MVILVVDDELHLRNSIQTFFEKQYEVITCEDGNAGLNLLQQRNIDVVLTDHKMPGMSGIELIRSGRELSPNTTFLLMTAFGSVGQAVEAIRLGAEDYLVKPFEFSELKHRLQRIEELKSFKLVTTLKQESIQGMDRLIGSSAILERIRLFVRTVSQVNSPVLILGPTGSGKEVVARAIHESGPQAMHSFIPVNCASLSEQLMESELFGHEKGAFTGAVSSKPGKFELAKSGTLFLDEIGEFSPVLQSKLLRVLQEKEFYKLGGTRQIKSEARVIAATHRNLKEMVKAGTFREDLYFRLNVLFFDVPPLREHRSDISLLIDFFMKRFSREFRKSVTLSPDTLDQLKNYSYPGNVRELQNVLERLMVLTPDGGVVQTTFLPSEFQSMKVPESLAKAEPMDVELQAKGLVPVVEAVEKNLIIRALELSGYRQNRAAKLLRLTRGAFEHKMRKHEINMALSVDKEAA